MRILAASLAVVLAATAWAGELAGVTKADSITTAGGASLVLNGMGLREKFWIDIYVGSLYLPAKSSDADAIISMDKPKQVVMTFIYRKVTQKQMLDTFRESFTKAGLSETLSAEMKQLESLINRDIKSGDEVIIDYVPGKGTSIIINGENRGTIAGTTFMKGIFSVFLGPNPASANLKTGMLGQ